MWDKAADDLLAALKLIRDCFITSKIIKELFAALYADENILYLKEGFGNVRFSFNEKGIFNIDLNSSNLDNKFDEDDHDAIIVISLMAYT